MSTEYTTIRVKPEFKDRLKQARDRADALRSVGVPAEVRPVSSKTSLGDVLENALAMFERVLDIAEAGEGGEGDEDQPEGD